MDETWKTNKLKEILLSRLRGIFHTSVDFISIVIHPLCKLLPKNRVRILCYHRVCDLPETNDVMRHLNIPPAVFDQQMAFLSQNGFNIITLEQFIEYKDDNKRPPPKSIIITFDDGYRDNYLNAFPILRKYGFKGTFFVVTDYISSERIFHWLKLGEKSLAHFVGNKQQWLPLTRYDILDMSAQGACFGSHTKSHCSLSQIDETRAIEELRGSKEYLEDILQKSLRCFCYPYGDMNKSVKNWVQMTGYRAAVAKVGSNTLKSDLLELRRIPIDGQDSLSKFARYVEGAYDWFEYVSVLLKFVKQIIFRR